jgi:outer membrane protein assembly factor BamB
VNDSTGETRWDFPLLADIPEESNTQEYTVLESNGPDQIEGANLPDGWVMVEDPQSGEMYYFNDATGETSWELPTEAQSEEPNEAEYEKQTALLDETKHETTCAADHNEPLSELPSGWEAVVDATSGETYYFNEETGETAWDPPTITGPGEVVASPSAAQPPQPATSDLPDGWRLVVDDGSGEEYYVNDIDNTTCWERPTGSDPEGVVVEKEFHESETNSNDTSALNDGWVTVHVEQSGDHTSATIVANSETNRLVEVAPFTAGSWVEINPEPKGSASVLHEIVSTISFA